MPPREANGGGRAAPAASGGTASGLSDEEVYSDVELLMSDEEGEDLFGDDYLHDYRAQPELDVYERRGLDENYVEEMDLAEQLAARRAADEELDMREEDEFLEGRRGVVRRLPGALADIDGPARRRRVPDAIEEDEELPEIRINLEQERGALRDFVMEESVQQEVARRFQAFLKTFEGERPGEKKYRKLIEESVQKNRTSVDVSFGDLATAEPTLAVWLVNVPRHVLEVFHDTAYDVARELFTDVQALVPHLFVRIHGLPESDCIRDIRQHHLDQLVKVTGVITRRTGVFPQLSTVYYDCMPCGNRMGPFMQHSEVDTVKPHRCPFCDGKGPFQVNMQHTVYRNYQKVTLQESPGTVPAGRLPRSKEVVLLHDLIDVARPGEQVEVTGIYVHYFSRAMNVQAGFPVFPTVIEVNNVVKQQDRFSAGRLTDEDKQAIMALARRPNIAQRIIKSVAPSIHGHADVKEAIALAMFGGQRKADGNHRLRGDINVLLLGDPGMAKSQFLKYVEKTAARAVYTTGKGASAVGLTAGVHKDPVTREWVLEGGALVLADRGVCLIDEFDKMNDQDRVSIHEAMEQQSISISKAGIVTQLQARCSVIAAANPEGGRYDPTRTFADNVNLPDPILSRFDILCVIRDIPDRLRDQQLAEFVVESHCRSHPLLVDAAEQEALLMEQDPDIISQDMLRKYITYAKQTCRPKLGATGYDKLAQVYAQLRQESVTTQGMPIAVRHLESMIRIAEAFALMHLRDTVENQDVDTAIRVMLHSFLGTQKFAVQQQLRRKFRSFLREPGEFRDLLMHLLETCFREAQRRAEVHGPLRNQRYNELCVVAAEFEERARSYQLRNLDEFYASTAFLSRGFTLDRERGYIVMRTQPVDADELGFEAMYAGHEAIVV